VSLNKRSKVYVKYTKYWEGRDAETVSNNLQKCTNAVLNDVSNNVIGHIEVSHKRVSVLQNKSDFLIL
jgi:hypothetical protein